MQTINLDIANKGIAQPINAKQGDVGRKFKILIFENGIPYDITANAVLFSMWYSGPSGDGNYDTIWTSSSENQAEGRYAFDVSENSVIVEMAAQMLKNPGNGLMCVTMKNSNGDIIGLWNIPYIVELVPGYLSEETKPYYPLFENLEQQIKNAVSVMPQSLTPSQQSQARANIDALKIPREIVRELFLSVDENDFQTQGDLNVFKFNEVLGWLQSPEDFDFRIRFSVRINIATVEEYEFTKADCRIEATVPSGRWRFYAATSASATTCVLTVANGISLVGSDSENSCSIAYPSEFEGFEIELYRIENTERELKVVTSVNGVEADENGNVELEVGGGSEIVLDTTLTQEGQAADAKAVGDRFTSFNEMAAQLMPRVLPVVTAADNGKALAVVEGVWTPITVSIPTEADINALIDARFVPLTQAEYDALVAAGTVDASKYYMIVGDSQ